MGGFSDNKDMNVPGSRNSLLSFPRSSLPRRGPRTKRKPIHCQPGRIRCSHEAEGREFARRVDLCRETVSTLVRTWIQGEGSVLQIADTARKKLLPMESWYNARTVLDSPHRNLLECFSKNDSFLDYAENWGLIVMPKRLASTVIFLLTTSLKEEEARYKKDIDLLRAAFGDKNCLHKIVQLGQIRNRALALPRFFHLVIPKLAILSGEDGIEPENLVSYFGDNFMGAFKIVLQNQMKQAGFPDTARFVQWAKEIVFWAIYSRTIFGQHAFKPKHAAIASEYMKPVIISKNPQSLYFEAMKPEADAPWHPYHSYWQATEGVVDLLFEKMSFGSDL